MYFLLLPHTTVYTVEDVHVSALEELFIKNTLISQVVFYPYVSVSDQPSM